LILTVKTVEITGILENGKFSVKEMELLRDFTLFQNITASVDINPEYVSFFWQRRQEHPDHVKEVQCPRARLKEHS